MYKFLKCFTMFIFGILASRKCDFCSFVNSSYEIKDFVYISVAIRNIYKDHFFLTIIIAKNVIFKNCICIYIHSIQCMSDVVSTILLKSVILQKHVQHR